MSTRTPLPTVNERDTENDVITDSDDSGNNLVGSIVDEEQNMVGSSAIIPQGDVNKYPF